MCVCAGLEILEAKWDNFGADLEAAAAAAEAAAGVAAGAGRLSAQQQQQEGEGDGMQQVEDDLPFDFWDALEGLPSRRQQQQQGADEQVQPPPHEQEQPPPHQHVGEQPAQHHRQHHSQQEVVLQGWPQVGEYGIFAPWRAGALHPRQRVPLCLGCSFKHPL